MPIYNLDNVYSDVHARAVCDLVNTHNNLREEITVDFVSRKRAQYMVHLDGRVLAGCMRVRRVQWYQAELSHLCVLPAYRRNGVARGLVVAGTQYAKDTLCLPIVQCTVRAENIGAWSLFLVQGFRLCESFDSNGRHINVYQRSA